MEYPGGFIVPYEKPLFCRHVIREVYYRSRLFGLIIPSPATCSCNCLEEGSNPSSPSSHTLELDDDDKLRPPIISLLIDSLPGIDTTISSKFLLQASSFSSSLRAPLFT
ncbi:hypothetical protein AMTRI_Chr01g130820 [Amborella trichopoda]